MRARFALALLLTATALTVRTDGAVPQKLLVLCSNGACQFRTVTLVLVAGRPSVKGLPRTTTMAGSTEMKTARELKLDQLQGLYRDARSGTVYTLGPDWEPHEVVVPFGFNPKTPTSVAAAWQATPVEFADAANAKTRTPVALDTLAYLIVAPDLEQAALQLAQRQVDAPSEDPRRTALVGGAVQFASKSSGMQQWREGLVNRMRAGVSRFDGQQGDPTTLGAAIREAAQLRSTYLQIAGETDNVELLKAVADRDALFTRRITIADALRQAAFWDEYLTKVRQLGLAKWSLPDILSHLREASKESATIHQQLSRRFSESGQRDRAFDEAELAARVSCDPALSRLFYDARLEFVHHNRIASSGVYSGPRKLSLEQAVRELERLDPSNEQFILARITEAEANDPNFLPLQWKKVEFLDMVGRYSAALDVLRRIERTVRLDAKEAEMALTLDGRVRNNLTLTVQKSLEETRKQFDLQRYPQAAEAAAKGLKADPTNGSLLYYSTLAVAFLRDRAAAMQLVQLYLRDANMSCGAADEPEKMLELYRVLAARMPAASPANGMPHWISGARYALGELFYDPISGAFQQPISSVSSKDGITTNFTYEDRSFLLRSVSTQISHAVKIGSTPSAMVFEAEPKYDRAALSMVDIGQRTAAERSPLTYLNSPGVDPDLVFRFTGRQIARGWAGNPFFHPFIFSGIYLFDLTYDRVGRIATATPVRESAGARQDPFSDQLQFVWQGDSNRLVSIRGARSGYLRELAYDKEGRLRSEKITYAKGGGAIEYEYEPDNLQLRGAKFSDNFYDKRERTVVFDQGQKTRY